jgi:hypothetical protein
MIGFRPHSVGRLGHRHRHVSRQEIHEQARAVRLEVLHHDKDEPGVGRQMSKELLQWLKATRRRAQADEQGSLTLAFVVFLAWIVVVRLSAHRDTSNGPQAVRSCRAREFFHSATLLSRRTRPPSGQSRYAGG